MTEKESYILNLVMDGKVLRRIAWHKWTSRDSIRDEIFLYLAASWAVLSELGLEHELCVSGEDLEAAFRDGGLSFTKEAEGFLVTLRSISPHVHVESGGMTVFTLPYGSAGVTLTPDSVVRLLRFIDEVLPEAERMVLERALRLEQEELATTFASRVFHTKLNDMAVPYRIIECCDHLKVDICLPPDGKMHLIVPPEKAVEVASLLEEVFSAAGVLYGLFGTDVLFYQLNRWDSWAEPYNRNV